MLFPVRTLLPLPGTPFPLPPPSCLSPDPSLPRPLSQQTRLPVPVLRTLRAPMGLCGHSRQVCLPCAFAPSTQPAHGAVDGLHHRHRAPWNLGFSWGSAPSGGNQKPLTGASQKKVALQPLWLDLCSAAQGSPLSCCLDFLAPDFSLHTPGFPFLTRKGVISFRVGFPACTPSPARRSPAQAIPSLGLLPRSVKPISE